MLVCIYKLHYLSIIGFMEKKGKTLKEFIPVVDKSISNTKNIGKKKKLNHVFVFYVYIGNLDGDDIEKYINKTAKRISLSEKYKGVECLFIPTREDYGTETIIRIL